VFSNHALRELAVAAARHSSRVASTLGILRLTSRSHLWRDVPVAKHGHVQWEASPAP
jgi:hypothetical protein